MNSNLPNSWEEKLRENKTPEVRLQVFMEGMASVGHSTHHLYFAGPWLSYLNQILADPQINLSNVSYTMFIDEYRDNNENELALSNNWLRLRYYAPDKSPSYCLKHGVTSKCDEDIAYEHTDDVKLIKKKLGCESLASSYARTIAQFYVLRCQFSDTSGTTSYIDIARLGIEPRGAVPLYYVLAKVDGSSKSSDVMRSSAAPECYPCTSQSKIMEALYHQNRQLYDKLAEKKIVAEHPESHTELSHVPLSKGFDAAFAEFKAKFEYGAGDPITDPFAPDPFESDGDC